MAQTYLAQIAWPFESSSH